jgi:hypothetical protein
MPAVKILEIHNCFAINSDMSEEQCHILESLSITDSAWGKGFDTLLHPHSNRLFDYLAERQVPLTELVLKGPFITNGLDNIASVMPDLWSCLPRLLAIEKLTLPIFCVGHLTDPLLFNGFNANLPSSLKVLHLSFKRYGYPMSDPDFPVFFEHALKALIPPMLTSNTLTVVVWIQHWMHKQLKNYHWNLLFPKINDLHLHFVISFEY